MPETYCHTLIPERIDFVPQPQQVARFLDDLVKLGAAPLEASLRVGKPGGFLTGINPVTREAYTIPRRLYTPVGAVADVPAALSGLEDYDLRFSGKGPPRIPSLRFDIESIYAFDVLCCLRPEVVSTSDWHDSATIVRGAPSFGQPDRSHNRLGIFHHPSTNEIIKVPNAGCALFWIEFEFGKWLLPQIVDSLDLLEPSIVKTTEGCFGATFAQGCHWYE